MRILCNFFPSQQVQQCLLSQYDKSIWDCLDKKEENTYIPVSVKSITARNCLRDLSLSQKVWSRWLGVTPEKLNLLLSFTSFVKADWSFIPHPVSVLQQVCERVVESGVFVEFDHRGSCVRSSLPPYTEISTGKCEAVTPVVFDGSEYGWGETRLCSWNLKTLLWSCQVFSQSQLITTPIQHFWLLRLRFIVLTG